MKLSEFKNCIERMQGIYPFGEDVNVEIEHDAMSTRARVVKINTFDEKHGVHISLEATPIKGDV